MKSKLYIYIAKYPRVDDHSIPVFYHHLLSVSSTEIFLHASLTTRSFQLYVKKVHSFLYFRLLKKERNTTCVYVSRFVTLIIERYWNSSNVISISPSSTWLFNFKTLSNKNIKRWCFALASSKDNYHFVRHICLQWQTERRGGGEWYEWRGGGSRLRLLPPFLPPPLCVSSSLLPAS